MSGPRPVRSKRDFVRRFAAGEFGNRTPTWDTPEQLHQFYMGYTIRGLRVPGLYHLRNRTAGGQTYYGLQWDECLIRWRTENDPSGWYVGQMIPDDLEKTLLLQGEVYRSEYGLALYYSTVPKPMRPSLLEGGTQVYLEAARSLLRWALNNASYEWLEYLLDAYPNHVVEFSAYPRPYGTLYPTYNTIIWECRRY
jgi:hypothetical protein